MVSCKRAKAYALHQLPSKRFLEAPSHALSPPDYPAASSTHSSARGPACFAPDLVRARLQCLNRILNRRE